MHSRIYRNLCIFISYSHRTGEALPIAVAVAAVIYFGGAVSGGHFNPAVSTMMLLKNNLYDAEITYHTSYSKYLGGVCALYFYQMTKAKSK